jgi:AcrR family transcriptional regulator
MAGERRTQAERRAAMRQRVLDATIDCLVERGYANTSTRHIAKRAGVTVGALQHHYDSKAELMAAALRELGERIADDVIAGIPADGALRERAGVMLDRLWAVHNGPLYDAGLELAVASRTDRELDHAMEAVAEAFALRIGAAMLTAFPELVTRPGFAKHVYIGLTTLRGLALPAFVGTIQPEDLWPAVREQLLDGYEQFAAEHEAVR